MKQALLDSQDWSAFLDPGMLECVVDAVLLKNEEKQFQSR
jgi:hypothetical protein